MSIRNALPGMLLFLFALSSSNVWSQDADRNSNAEEKNAKEKSAVMEIMRTASLIDSAYRIADQGRQEKSPELLLAAARTLSTVPVRKLETDKNDTPDPEESLRKDADTLIGEALILSKGLPENERKLIQELAQHTKSRSAEQKRGVPGGPRMLGPIFLQPNESETFQFDLVGGFTTINVSNSFGFRNYRVQVIGALTGLNYADQMGPVVNANFQHLPIAKVVVIVTNIDSLPGSFTLRTN